MLWPLAGAGLLKAFLAMFVQFGWLDATSQGYTILSPPPDALFNFLPILLAVTAAKRFKTNQFTSMAIAGALVYPSIVALNDGNPVSFFGIPVVMVSYVSSVLPILVGVWLQSYLEKFLARVIPSAFRNFMVPLLTMLIMVPLILLSVGPLTSFAGKAVSSGVGMLWNLSPFVGGLIMGGLWQVFVLFGLHWGFVPVIINDIATQGPFDPDRPAPGGRPGPGRGHPRCHDPHPEQGPQRGQRSGRVVRLPGRHHRTGDLRCDPCR
ncbi:MAG: PTS transporter subunit EIIC [Micropruina sp.]|nr:PTS transporter subunit EIIC [Micropruina sp.]